MQPTGCSPISIRWRHPKGEGLNSSVLIVTMMNPIRDTPNKLIGLAALLWGLRLILSGSSGTYFISQINQDPLATMGLLGAATEIVLGIVLVILGYKVFAQGNRSAKSESNTRR